VGTKGGQKREPAGRPLIKRTEENAHKSYSRKEQKEINAHGTPFHNLQEGRTLASTRENVRPFKRGKSMKSTQLFVSQTPRLEHNIRTRSLEWQGDLMKKKDHKNRTRRWLQYLWGENPHKNALERWKDKTASNAGSREGKRVPFFEQVLNNSQEKAPTTGGGGRSGVRGA